MTQEEANEKLVTGAGNGNLDLLREALDAGAQIDAVVRGRAALSDAALYGRVDCVRLLLERKAGIDAPNGIGSTALICAAYGIKKHPAECREIIYLLLAAGADPAIVNEYKKSAAAYAKENDAPDIVELLGQPKGSFRRDPDEVLTLRPVADRLLQESFNFEKRELVSMIRQNEFGPVESLSISPFDAVEEGKLRAAFNIYKARGGPRTEEDIFNGSIPKPRLERSL